MGNRNLQWNKRVKVPLILIFSVNTNHESVAYRSFSPSRFEVRGVRKVTTGINQPLVPGPVYLAGPSPAPAATTRTVGLGGGMPPGRATRLDAGTSRQAPGTKRGR